MTWTFYNKKFEDNNFPYKVLNEKKCTVKHLCLFRVCQGLDIVTSVVELREVVGHYERIT